MKTFFLNGLAAPLLLFRRRLSSSRTPRILVIRRQKMGDLICTLPLLHALRKKFPGAHLTVACDPPGAPIAQACSAVDEVIVLRRGFNRWLDLVLDAARLQNFDLVIAAKGGFDRRLAFFSRLTNAPRRIGFVSDHAAPSVYFTDTIALPENPYLEHQSDTQMRLLAPLGIPPQPLDFSIQVPEPLRAEARERLIAAPFARHPDLILLNLSSNRPIQFAHEDFLALVCFFLQHPTVALGLISTPQEKTKAETFARECASDRVVLLSTPGPLALAAYLEKARLLITAEGGAAHLAAATQTPALVFWSEGPIEKWRSRCDRHFLLQKQPQENTLPLERVLSAMKTHHLLS